MTHTTLIYNPNAGWLDLVTPEQLEEGLQEAGYAVEYRPTERVEDLDQALDRPGEVVVVAGGDGTVRAAALRLFSQDVSLAILPMGTANNIARTLGIQGPVSEIVAGLADPRSYNFDLGQVRAPWGRDIFLETFGLGFFAHAVACFGPPDERTLPKALWAITEALVEYRSHSLRMTFDGQDLSGDYLIVNLFNTPLLGPRLEVVHQADPGDGALDLMCIGEGDRAALVRSVTGLVSRGLVALPPNVTFRRGKRLEVTWDGFPVHVDNETRPPGMDWPEGRSRPDRSATGEGDTLTVEVRPGALRLLLPASASPESAPGERRMRRK